MRTILATLAATALLAGTAAANCAGHDMKSAETKKPLVTTNQDAPTPPVVPAKPKA